MKNLGNLFGFGFFDNAQLHPVVCPPLVRTNGQDGQRAREREKVVVDCNATIDGKMLLEKERAKKSGNNNTERISTKTK